MPVPAAQKVEIRPRYFTPIAAPPLRLATICDNSASVILCWMTSRRTDVQTAYGEHSQPLVSASARAVLPVVLFAAGLALVQASQERQTFERGMHDRVVIEVNDGYN